MPKAPFLDPSVEGAGVRTLRTPTLPRSDTSSWALRNRGQGQASWGPHPCRQGLLCMPPPRQGGQHSAIKNNTNSGSHCAAPCPSHFAAHARPHWSPVRGSGCSHCPRSGGREPRLPGSTGVCKVSPARAALGPRSRPVSPGVSLLSGGAGQGGEQDRGRVAESEAVAAPCPLAACV